MILLSFDIEEFDTPLEYGVNIPLDEQMQHSIEGTERILSLLKKHNIKATFFCTAVFALNARKVIQRIMENGHEVASHGYHHSSFAVEDLAKSKKVLEGITHTPVNGYRMARMMPVDDQEIKNAGYTYNTSLNPTFIPGRYCNLTAPRTYFEKDGLLQIPASVSPWVRFPLFWLSFHNLPYSLYKWLSVQTLKKDGYLNIYFHPWEFVELKELKHLGLPYIITNQSGQLLINKLDRFITGLKKKGSVFATYSTFISELSRKNPSHSLSNASME